MDRSCIDCGTCYEFLPAVFLGKDGHSQVRRQPSGPGESPRALMAVLACPTASIGTDLRKGMADAVRAFPDPIEGEVSFCGLTSEKSYGTWSYFIRRGAGNVLVDSPRACLLYRLLAFDFTWVLPGHGGAHHTASPEAMRADLELGLALLRAAQGRET